VVVTIEARPGEVDRIAAILQDLAPPTMVDARGQAFPALGSKLGSKRTLDVLASGDGVAGHRAASARS
jgi:hypothetical protein